MDFNKKYPPRWADFAYTALRRAMLSYVLGAIVPATTINLVSGLVR